MQLRFIHIVVWINTWICFFFFSIAETPVCFLINCWKTFWFFFPSIFFLAITNQAAIKIQVQNFVLIKVLFCLSKHVGFHLLNYMVNICLIFKNKKPSKLSSKVAISYYTSKSNEWEVIFFCLHASI